MGLAVAALLAAAWLARRRRPACRRRPGGTAVRGRPPSYPAYIDDPLTRFVVTMVAVPAAAGLAALAAVTVLEWLMIRPVAPRRSEPGG
jgi:hypothetical protein